MSAPRIHPQAIVEPGAELGVDVEVGPFCHVHGGARIGDRTRLLSHVVVGAHTTIGSDNQIHSGAVLGGPPQDKTYRGEPTTLMLGYGHMPEPAMVPGAREVAKAVRAAA